MEKKDEGQSGAVIIEASIALPVFMFLMITLYSLIQIAYVQSRTTLALDCAAKELAEYAHILYATGADKYIEGGGGYSSQLADKVAEFLETVGSEIGNYHEEMGKFVTDAGGALRGDSVVDYLKFITEDWFCQQLMKKNMVNGFSDTPEAFMRRNRIENWGMDIEKSSVLEGAGKDIFLVMKYDIKVIQLFKIDFKFHMSSCAYTHAWSGE